MSDLLSAVCLKTFGEPEISTSLLSTKTNVPNSCACCGLTIAAMAISHHLDLGIAAERYVAAETFPG
jgi:hypothetical protein